MNNKSILLISSDYPNTKKSSNIYTDLTEALSQHGYKVTVVVTEESKNIAHTNISHENEIQVLRVKVGNIYNVGFIEKGISFLKSGLLTKKAISKYLKDYKFDLILFMSQPVTIANSVKWAMKKFHAPSYLMMKDIFPQNGVDLGIMSKKSPIYWYFRHQEKKLYKTATTIGCMSEENRKYLLKHNKYLKEEKLAIFPNTQKIDELKTVDTNYPIRKKYNIPTNTVLAIYGGNIGKPQGVDFFIKVLDRYKNKKEINFLILARGTDKQKLYDYIDKNNITNVYKFELMPREDYQKIVAESDIGLIFLNERFTIPNYPSKVLPYFNLGIPVMAALDLNNDFKNMLDETKSGFWAKAGDIEDYSNKLNKLIESKELRKNMGLNGRKCLEEKFSVEESVKIINNYIEKYGQRKDDNNV